MSTFCLATLSFWNPLWPAAHSIWDWSWPRLCHTRSCWLVEEQKISYSFNNSCFGLRSAWSIKLISTALNSLSRLVIESGSNCNRTFKVQWLHGSIPNLLTATLVLLKWKHVLDPSLRGLSSHLHLRSTTCSMSPCSNQSKVRDQFHLLHYLQMNYLFSLQNWFLIAELLPAKSPLPSAPGQVVWSTSRAGDLGRWRWSPPSLSWLHGLVTSHC